MGKALELVTAKATQPNTGAAFAANTGNSLTVRAGAGAKLVHSWQTRQVAGFTRVTSPLLHDGTVGMQNCGPIGTTLFSQEPETLQAQDALTVYGSGSNVGGDIEFWSGLIAYQSLPGADVMFLSPADLRRRAVDCLTVPTEIATGTSGEYTGAELINAEADQFKADTMYALLGASVQVGAHALRWYGPDFGGLGVGMPGMTGMERGADYFVWLSEVTGLPLIPVVRSANKGFTFVDAVVDENGANPVFCTHYVRIR